MKLEKVDRVPFSVTAKPRTDCPFYRGAGKDVAADFYERYCVAKKMVALYYYLGQERILTGCCGRFGCKLPNVDQEKLFAVAERKKNNHLRRGNSWKRREVA